MRILVGAAALTAALTAQSLTTLYDFGAYPYDAGYPSAAVIIGPQGQLYGTTDLGGERDLGAVYELLPPAAAGGTWTESVLQSFGGTDGNGRDTA